MDMSWFISGRARDTDTALRAMCPQNYCLQKQSTDRVGRMQKTPQTILHGRK